MALRRTRREHQKHAPGTPRATLRPSVNNGVLQPNMPKEIGTCASAPGLTRMRSWTASCTTTSGSRPAATTCENTPPTRSRPKPSRGRAPPAPDRATARHRKAIPAAPEGNIQRPPNPKYSRSSGSSGTKGTKGTKGTNGTKGSRATKGTEAIEPLVPEADADRHDRTTRPAHRLNRSTRPAVHREGEDSPVYRAWPRQSVRLHWARLGAARRGSTRLETKLNLNRNRAKNARFHVVRNDPAGRMLVGAEARLAQHDKDAIQVPDRGKIHCDLAFSSSKVDLYAGVEA